MVPAISANKKGQILNSANECLEFETLTTLAAMSCVWCSFRQTSQGRYLYNHSAETSRWYAAMSCVWFSLGQTLTCGKNQVACWYRNGEPVSSTCFSEKEPGSCDYWRQKHGTRSSFTEVWRKEWFQAVTYGNFACRLLEIFAAMKWQSMYRLLSCLWVLSDMLDGISIWAS